MEAVKESGFIKRKDLDYALGFQRHALEADGTHYPLDRILLKFGYLTREQVTGLYRAIRYYSWRREDKFFLKIAIQSRILSQRQSDACLVEQKESYRDRNDLRRCNEIARVKGFMTAKEETAVIEAMSKCRGVTIRAVDLLEAVRSEPTEPSELGLNPVSNHDRSRSTPSIPLEDEPIPSLDDYDGAEIANVRALSDDDLDALWDEADLDDIDLASGSRNVAASPLLDSDDDLDYSSSDDLF